ncbi:MAG TPA: hypothetical protein VM869_19185 [Enhygromyxa sp.]|nr:hypothetical protein [Enhygromyxa sp.]
MASKLTTERAVYAAIRQRFSAPEYAVLPGVSNGTGANHRRTIDAVIMSTWPSRGLTLAGVEIKVSRSDLTRELANPAKQESHFKFFDHFYLAVGDASIVREGDVPAAWGLLVPGRGGTSMKVAKEAPTLTPEPISRAFLAAILRRADEQLGSKGLRGEIRKELEAELAEELERLRGFQAKAYEFDRVEQELALMHRFERASGVRFSMWNESALDEAAAIVRTFSRGGRESMANAAAREAAHAKLVAQRMIENADKILAELDRERARIDQLEDVAERSTLEAEPV